MSGICNAVMPAGAVECLKKAGAPQYLVIDDLSVSFSSDADFISKETNKALIRESMKSYVFELADFEAGTADATMATLASTRNVVIDKPIPNMIAYADMSFCDQMQLVKTLKGQTYRVRIVTIDREILAYKRSDGIIKGFKADISAITTGIPQKSDIDKTVKLYINFASYEEFENSIIAVPDFSFGITMVESTPVGLNIAATGDYDTGVLPVQINTRCSDGMTELVTDDVVVISSNVVTPTVTVVEGINGAYNFTIQAGASPVDLVSGDTVVIQIQKKTGDIVDFVSNRLTIAV